MRQNQNKSLPKEERMHFSFNFGWSSNRVDIVRLGTADK